MIHRLPLICCLLWAAQCLDAQCIPARLSTTVFYANGINTSSDQARSDAAVLQAKVDQVARSRGEIADCIQYALSYNQTVGFWEDLWQATKQRLGEDVASFMRYLADIDSAPQWFQTVYQAAAALGDEYAYDQAPELNGIVQAYRDTIAHGDKVLVVPHSQGNLYANAAYRKLQSTGTALPNDAKMTIVSVATPSSRTEGNGPYTTLWGDFVIRPIPGARPWNVTNLPFHWDGHSFVKRYLTAGARSETQILGQIVDNIVIKPPMPSATTITFDFIGVVGMVTYSGGVLGNSVPIGTIVTGMFSYDTNAIDSVPEPTLANYSYSTGASKVVATLNTPSGQKTAATDLAGGQQPLKVVVSKYNSGDVFIIYGVCALGAWQLPVLLPLRVGIMLEAYPPVSFLQSDALPTTLDLSRTKDGYQPWSSGSSFIQGGGDFGSPYYSIRFRLIMLSKR